MSLLLKRMSDQLSSTLDSLRLTRSLKHNPGWPHDTLNEALTDPQSALDLLSLLIDADDWMHRRVESVTFYSHVAAHKHISIDLSIPALAPRISQGSANTRLLPLSILRKEPLRRFSLRDEAGNSVPVLTTRENGELIATGLVAWASSILQTTTVPHELSQTIHLLVTASPERAAELYSAIEGGEVIPKESAQQLLRADAGSFDARLRDLRDHFVLMALVAESQQDRRVLKLSYDGGVTLERVASNTLAKVGWRCLYARFAIDAPFPINSYHFELAEPDDVSFSHAKFDNMHGQRELVKGGHPTVHLHLGSLREGDRRNVAIGMLPERRGWLRSSTIANLGLVGLLWILYWRLPTLLGADANLDRPAIIILLGATSIAASFLTRPWEHRLATHILFLLRLIAVVPALCGFGAATLVLLQLDTGDVILAWKWISVLALIAVVVCLVALFRPRTPNWVGRRYVRFGKRGIEIDSGF